MNFIVSSTELLKQVQMISGVINSSNTMPILDNYLFNIANDQLTITASDLETTIYTSIKVKGDFSGKIAVPSKLLTETLKTFSEQPLTIKIKEEEHLFEIISEQGNYSFGYEDGDEYPMLPSIEDPSKVTLPSTILGEAISKTLFATGNDELRPVMTGVFFQLGTDKCTFVATDAHKLVEYTRKDIQANENAEFIMPKKPLNLLKNIIGSKEDTIDIEYNKVNAKFTINETTLISRLIDGKYPNYDAVIPKENPNVLTINRSSFLNSIKRVSIFANKTTYQTKLKLAGNQLQISAEDIDFSNKADERLNCNYDGDDLIIGFNSKFLSEMLNNLSSEDITIEMSEPNRAGIIRPVDGIEEGEEVLMLVMPVMIGS